MGREASTCRRSGKLLPASVKKSNAQESRKSTKNLGDKGELAGFEPNARVRKAGLKPACVGFVRYTHSGVLQKRSLATASGSRQTSRKKSRESLHMVLAPPKRQRKAESKCKAKKDT